MDFHDGASRGVDPDSRRGVVSSLAWHSGRTPFDHPVSFGGEASMAIAAVVQQAGIVHSSEV